MFPPTFLSFLNSRTTLTHSARRLTPNTLRRAARNAKLAVYSAVVNFYAQEPKDTRFKELWRELHLPAVYAFGLDVRMKRAGEGKEAANKCVPPF